MKNSSAAELSATPQIDFTKSVIKITPGEIAKNKERHNQDTLENSVIRLDYLSKIDEQLKEKLGRPPTRKEMLDQMRLIGFDMSIATLWRDKGRNLNRKSWLRDLLQEGTFSAYQNDSSELLDYIKEKAIEFLNHKWTASKKVIKTSDEGDKTESTITTELATPKYNFLYILTRVVEVRKQLISGDNIDLSLAMLQEDFQKVKEHDQKLT